MNYGLVYGLSVYGLFNQFKVSVGEVKEFMVDYFSWFGKVYEYFEEVVDQVCCQGYIEIFLGCCCYFFDFILINCQC